MFFEVTVKNHDTGKLHRFTDCVCGTESENRAASYENAVETGVIPKDWTNYTLTMKAKETEGKKGFVCKVCGYIYEGDELPEDYICPLCKHGAADFEPIA